MITRPAPGWLAPGARVYAIGDVHGCVDRLVALHDQVAEDLRRRPIARPLLLHLGDYVDRGPHAAAVIRRLAAGPTLPGVPSLCLRGNHEQMLLDALDGLPHARALWLSNGARPTLNSWGADPDADTATWHNAMAAELPFLHSLALNYQLDGYLFVHAGIRPGTPLAQQTAQDQLWIREEFLHWRGELLPEMPGVAVVHGHTPLHVPVIAGQRIGIDTGAVMGGSLTCAVLEGRAVHFLTA